MMQNTERNGYMPRASFRFKSAHPVGMRPREWYGKCPNAEVEYLHRGVERPLIKSREGGQILAGYLVQGSRPGRNPF